MTLRTPAEWLKQPSAQQSLSVLKRFAALHGETPCFLISVPDGSEDAVDFCVSKRADQHIHIAHVDPNVLVREFPLSEDLPKGRRVVNWNAFIEKKYAQKARPWKGALVGALQFYLNSHTGPTGQVELSIPGLNIVVSANVPPSDTALTVGGLMAIAAATGEYEKISSENFYDLCSDAQDAFHGRKEDLEKTLNGSQIIA
jgi:hypothetical protein